MTASDAPVVTSEGDLPEGWAETAMGEIADVIGGGTPTTSEPDNFSDDGHAWITPADLSGFTEMYVGRGRRGLTDKGLRSCSGVTMPKGTVLMSSRAPIGYLAVAANPISTNQGFKSFVCHPEILSEFVYFWLKFLVPEIQNMGSGSTFSEISGSRAKEIRVQIPPTIEQRHIVEKIEQLLNPVNAARERLARVAAILKRFRQAVLAAACSGRLTEDWRYGHTLQPGASLLQGIASNYEDRWNFAHKKHGGAVRGKNTEPAWKLKYDMPADNKDEFSELPVNWVSAPLGMLGKDPLRTVQTGPFGAQLHRDEFTKTGVPVVAVGNLTGMGFSDFGLYFVTSNKAKQLVKYDVQAGDVLFARSGATLGKVCVAPSYIRDWRMTGHILRARFDEALLLPEYAVFALHGEPTVIAQVTGNIRGVTRPGFNTSLLETIRLPLPPREEQREIVRRVEKLFKLADSIEKRVAAAAARADKLTQAILAKAFRGELVPTEAELARREGRTYEPASALLDRIRAERKNVGIARKSRTTKRS